MAVNKQLEESHLILEVQNGVDAAGDAKYTSKTLGGLKSNADPDAVFRVSQSVKALLSTGTRKSYIRELSALVNAE